MKKGSRKRARFGDLVEVRTPRGLAYIQYTSKHPEYSDTVRVLPGLFEKRPPPEQLAALATQEGYFTFYLVSLAVRYGLVEIIGEYPIPPGLEAPSKLLRAGLRTREGRALGWWLWDGVQEIPMKRPLTAEEKHISLASMWNHEYLVYRLAEEWRPEHEHIERPAQPAPSAPPEAPPPEEAPPASTQPTHMRHYLYFPHAKVGKVVAAELRKRGFTVESRKSADGKNWLVLAGHALTQEDPDASAVREELERLAQQHSGQYDGHEMELPE